MLFYFKCAWCDMTVQYGLLQMTKHMHQYRDERASLYENFLYRKSTNNGLVNSLQFYRHDACLSGVGLINHHPPFPRECNIYLISTVKGVVYKLR